MTRRHPKGCLDRPTFPRVASRRRPTSARGAMVNLTRIYTRTGDGGETRLGDMSTTTKNDLRLAAYADVDEANAHLGRRARAGRARRRTSSRC